MKEEVHQRGDHEHCEQETEDRPAIACLKSDWRAVAGVHNTPAVRALGLKLAGWLEILRVVEGQLLRAGACGEPKSLVHEYFYVSGAALAGERLRQLG